MENLKVVFMGTPEFSVPILDALIKNYNIVLVVTSPDAPYGRKKIMTACPVKKLALENNIDVFSPFNIKNDYDLIKEINPDIIITCAYGQIIPEELLNIPKLGCINIHASLLPKYRGGAPIHHALMNGDRETGITLMYMDKGMDSGDMIVKEEIKINEEDDIESLSQKLSLLGTKMIIEHLPNIIQGNCPREKQDESKVIFSPIIKREHELIDFYQTNEEVYNLCRALSPAPLPYFVINGTEYKVAKCEKVKANGEVNTVTEVTKDSFTIMCSNGGIKITRIKPFGKSIMNVRDYFNGFNKDSLIGAVVNK